MTGAKRSPMAPMAPMDKNRGLAWRRVQQEVVAPTCSISATDSLLAFWAKGHHDQARHLVAITFGTASSSADTR